MSKSEDGSIFEAHVSRLLIIDTTARSGAHWDNGDLFDKEWIIECKVKNTFKNFRPVAKEVKKLIAQADKHMKEWAYVQRCQAGDFVMISLDQFAAMLSRLREHEDP